MSRRKGKGKGKGKGKEKGKNSHKISRGSEIKGQPQPKQIEPTQSQRLALIWRLGAKGVTALSICASLIGLLGVYVLRPDVSIEPYATMNPTLPFEQQFSVQNNSAYSIHGVVPECGFDENSNFNFKGLSISSKEERVDTLEPGTKTTLTCSIRTGPIRTELNIMPWVLYRAFGVSQCKAEKFKGKVAANGAYIWTYNGSEGCRPGAHTPESN